MHGLISIQPRPQVAEASIDEAFCRRYAASSGQERHWLIQDLIVFAIDAVSRITELTLTRYVEINGCVHWEHVSDTLTLDLFAKAGKLSYHIDLTTPDGTTHAVTHTWFDPDTMPCYLTSLAERVFEDAFDLCHHAAALSCRESTHQILLPRGTKGPHGEPPDRISESRLLIAHPYLIKAGDPVPSVTDIAWKEENHADD